MKTVYSITVNGKRYQYFVTPHVDSEYGKLYFLECPAARIKQSFDAEDFMGVLENLPDWITECQKRLEKQSSRIAFRITNLEKSEIEKKAREKGYKNMSEFLRNLALEA